MELKRKLARMEPLLRTKEADVLKETQILAELLLSRQNCQKALNQSQQSYLQGVEAINRIRQSSLRTSQSVMETSVDYAREKWVAYFRELKHWDQKIQMQRANLYKAQSRLQETEKLAENYKLQWRQFLDKQAQNELEDLHLGKIIRARKESA